MTVKLPLAAIRPPATTATPGATLLFRHLLFYITAITGVVLSQTM